MRILRIAALLGSFCFLAFSLDTDGNAAPVVPEPSLVILMGAAMAGIGAVAWRRNRKK
jgi:hypothetical protein